MNQLEQLKKMTVVVADSGDIETIPQFAPQDVTTNPALILQAASLPAYHAIITQAVTKAKEQGGSRSIQLINACDHLTISLGAEIIKKIPGRVSTEIDARLSFDHGLCIAKARKLIKLYQLYGVDKSRVMIKLAATWEGIRAAEKLEQEGINCNLTLLFSQAQARACAEAGVYMISPFVGRIYDWHQQNNPQKTYQVEHDAGVIAVQNFYRYYKEHRYSTFIMPASFRRIEQVQALAGCDRITISPELLSHLQQNRQPLEKKLMTPRWAANRPSPLTEAEFRWQHNQDAMAVEKLSEGVRLFAIDQQKLEDMLHKQL